MCSICQQILCLFRRSVAGYMTENKCKRCDKESAYIKKVACFNIN